MASDAFTIGDGDKQVAAGPEGAMYCGERRIGDARRSATSLSTTPPSLLSRQGRA